MRRPASSITALTLPVRLRRVASGLMIEKVRETAIFVSNWGNSRALYRRGCSKGKDRYKAPEMLAIDNIVVRIAGREILSGATANLPAGRRIGLVGRNGAGKSTLFNVILGRLHQDDGEISVPAAWRVGAVAQEAPGTDTSLLDTVLEADPERLALLAEAEHETDGHKLGDIYHRLDAIDAYTAPARAAEILAGLGFSAEDQLRPCKEFSGGWRMRVALAAILFTASDLLLLDEPTNYLDLEGVLWLENFIQKYRGT